MRRLAAAAALTVAAALTAGQAAPAWGVQNRKPVLAEIGDRTAAEGTLSTFTAAAADPEGDPIVFSLFPQSRVPAGASIDPDSGVFTWTPGESQGPGSYTFKVIANDDQPGQGDQQTVTVTVEEVNQAPEVGAITDRTDDVGAAVSFTVSVSDADIPPNAITWSASGVPPGVAFHNGQFIDSPAEPGVYQVTVTAVDDGEPALGGVALFTWTVVDPDGGGDPPVNQPPTIGSIPDRADVQGAAVSFPVTASDADGGALTFAATGLPSGIGIATGDGTISGTLGASSAAGSPYTVAVTVTDDGGASAVAIFTWTVSAAEPPPADPDTGTGDGSDDGGGGGPPPGSDTAAGDDDAVVDQDDGTQSPPAAGASRGHSTHDTATLDLSSLSPVASPASAAPPYAETRREVGPVRGLVVGFRNAVEGVRQNTVPNLALVSLVTILGILGLGDRPPWRRRKTDGE